MHGISRQSVQRWAAALARAGPAALRARKATGQPPKLLRAHLAALPALLQQGAQAHGFETDRWTTARVATVIARWWGVRYDRNYVCRLLHALAFSWQRPARQAREAGPGTLRQWLRRTRSRVSETRAKSTGAGLSPPSWLAG